MISWFFVLVLRVSSTRTRRNRIEYEYHFIEYEYERCQNSATSKWALWLAKGVIALDTAAERGDASVPVLLRSKPERDIFSCNLLGSESSKTCESRYYAPWFSRIVVVWPLSIGM